MKATILRGALAAFVLIASTAFAAESAELKQRKELARELAERLEIKNELKRLQGDVEELISSQNDLLRQLDSLKTENETAKEEISRLREDLAREKTLNITRYTTQDEFKILTDKVKELDEKRAKDGKAIADEIDRLSKQLPTLIKPLSAQMDTLDRRLRKLENRPPPSPRASSAPVSTPNKDLKGWTHVIEQGHFLTRVISAYNDEWKNAGGKGTITLDSVKKANPGMNPNQLKIGQEIFIPQPGQ